MMNEELGLCVGDEAFRDPHDAGVPAAWAAPGGIGVDRLVVK